MQKKKKPTPKKAAEWGKLFEAAAYKEIPMCVLLRNGKPMFADFSSKHLNFLANKHWGDVIVHGKFLYQPAKVKGGKRGKQ